MYINTLYLLYSMAIAFRFYSKMVQYQMNNFRAILDIRICELEKIALFPGSLWFVLRVHPAGSQHQKC